MTMRAMKLMTMLEMMASTIEPMKNGFAESWRHRCQRHPYHCGIAASVMQYLQRAFVGAWGHTAAAFCKHSTLHVIKSIMQKLLCTSLAAYAERFMASAQLSMAMMIWDQSVK